MGKKEVLKKSVFGGFKKEDVINYIEQLQQEIVNLKRELSDCSAYKRDLEIMKNSKEQLEKELSAQCEENTSLKAKNSELTEINNSLNLKTGEMNISLENSERKLREFEKIAEKLKSDLAESESNLSKLKEAEKIIVDAKESATAIKTDTKNIVVNAHSDILSANDRIKTACVNFDSAAASLRASADGLLNALSQACEKLDSVGTEEA